MSLFETVWDGQENNRESKLNACKSKGQGLQSSMRNLKELGWLWLSGLVSRAAPPKLKSDWVQFARTSFLECDQFTIYMQPVGHFTIFICNQLLHATAATSKSCKKVSNCLKAWVIGNAWANLLTHWRVLGRQFIIKTHHVRNVFVRTDAKYEESKN